MERIISGIGREVSYFPVDGGTKTVEGVYESPAREFLGLEASRPRLSCLLREVPEPRHGDAFEWGEFRYKVVGVEKDEGCGICILSLEARP